MAIISFTNYKRGQTTGCMGAVMRYTMQDKKTEFDGQRLVTGINCQSESVYADFMTTKRLHHKIDGVLFYHMVQSFPKGEAVNPVAAHAAALKLAEYYEGYEVLVCTHTDREHIHSHFLINSVNFDTGRKLHIAKEQLQELRQRNDMVCKEFSLPVFQPREQKQKTKTMTIGEYHTAARGQSKKLQLMNIINDCMRHASNREEFIALMESEGYKVRWESSRRNITYTTPSGWQCRDRLLFGDKYLKENMEYEFIIRQNLCKAFARRADETEYAGAASGRNGTRERADRQPAGNDFADAGYGFGTRPAGSTDTGDTQRDGNPTPEGLADDRKFAEGNENTAPRQRTTGWESARPDFFADRKIQSPGSHYPMGAQHSVRPAKPAHSGIGDLAGLASAVSILNNGDFAESEEEKREREARENGNAIGAVVGSAIGLLSVLDSDCDEDFNETESEENTFELFM